MADASKTPQTGQQGQEIYAGTKGDDYTAFIKGGQTKLLVSLPQWAKVTLRLESAGPVAFGTVEQLTPVGSGKGRLLPRDTDVIVTMVPNTRLYVAADSFQRVAVQVEPFPWMWELFNKLKTLAPSIGSIFQNIFAGRR